MEYDYGSFDALGGDATAFSAAADPSGIGAAIERAFGPSEEPKLAMPPDTTTRVPFGVVVDGVAHREAEVRELTGADEEVLARASGSYLRWSDAIITQGTVSVGGKKATRELLRSLTVADRETLLLLIRIATYGDQLKLPGFRCPECGERSDLTVHLGRIEIRGPEDPACRVFEVALRGATATVRQPTGEDLMAFDGKELTVPAGNTLMLSRVIVAVEFDDGPRTVRPGSMALARELGMADRKALLDAITANTYGPRYEDVSIVHEACGQEVPVPLSAGDLFRG
jgi:hypothetical protein